MRPARGLLATLSLALSSLLACAHETPEATSGQAPATGADAATGEAQPATGESKPAEMGLTGVLDEKSFAALHQLTDTERPAPRGEMIELAGTQAYLSLPEGEGPHPGVIVIHEWWGLNPHIKYWSDRLAADGYAALAVDLYGGESATTPEEAMALMKGVDAAKAKSTLAAAASFLAEDARVAAQRRAVIGWCFGGGWSLQSAIEIEGLDAAVLYYGRLIEDPEALKKIEAPILAIFGDRDEGIPPAVVDSWAEAMKKAERKVEILRYDAEHAFANPSGAHYDAVAAEDAWKRARAFLASHLEGPQIAEGGGKDAACNATADCAADMICEGQGCGDMEGRCVPKQRACTRDLRPYCGCDGVTFRASGSCPGARYRSQGACEG